MNLQEFSERFNPLSPQKKISFIYSNIECLPEEEKISFLYSIIKEKKSSPIVRATAIKFLGNTSYQEFELFHEYLEDKHKAVAKAARKALKNLESQEKKNIYISKSIIVKIQSCDDKQKRLKMIKALAKNKAGWIPHVLLDALEDPSEEIRDFIIKELGQRKYLNLNLVYQRLRKPPWYSKSAALKILGIKKNPASIKHIEAVLKEPNVDVRMTAAQTLGEIGGRDSLGLLAKLAKDKNPYIKISAEEALRKASNLRFT